VNSGAYDLLVGGSVRGSLSVVVDGNGTRGKLKFESESGGGNLLLNFEVEGQEIIIRQGDTVYFSRIFPAS
jgi:hypothetical protein